MIDHLGFEVVDVDNLIVDCKGNVDIFVDFFEKHLDKSKDRNVILKGYNFLIRVMVNS